MIVALLGGALMLSGCVDDRGTANEDEQSSENSSEGSTNAERETDSKVDNGSGEGAIDIESGYTQEEQMVELAAVVDVMREHFGEDVATIDGQPWTAERHDAEIAPRPRGDDVYRHTVEFDIAPDDLEETYEIAAKIAKELGLSENLGNSDGFTEYGEIFFGAGKEEGRSFRISGESAELSSATYRTRNSDDPSLSEAFERVVEKNSQDRDAEEVQSRAA